MNLRKMTALLCCGVMIAGALFSGCGNAAESSRSNGAGESDAGTVASSEIDSATSAGEDSVYTVRVWGYGDANSDDLKAVSEKISEITRGKIGVNVDLYRTMDSEKLNLALTSGEKMDLVCIHGMSLSTLISTGRILPLDELFEEYAKDVKAVVSDEDLRCGRTEGILYTLPTNNDNARASGFAMRKDIVEALDIDASKIKSLEDMHEVLVQVKEAYPDIYPLVPTWAGGGMQSIFHTDNIGPGNLGVLEDATTDSTTVVNLYETEEYRNFVYTMYQWQQEGLIMPDATTTTENNPIGSVGFASFENIIPGKELDVKKKAGIDAVLAEITPAIKNTDMVTGTFCIAAASENPAKAMELYNLMYTDPEVANLLTNGIEGKHYEFVDDSKKMIKLPEGAAEGSTGYTSLDWAWPNCMITPVWEGGDPDLWKKMDDFNKSAISSPALGFQFDSAAVMNEVTACQNVQQKYTTALSWGTLNPDEALPQFNKELKDAGLDTIIAEVQSQLDAWLSENK